MSTDRPVSGGTGRASAATSSGRTGSGRRRAVGLVLVLALVTLAAGVPVWLRTAGATALAGQVPVVVTGTQAAPAVSAAALVLLAAGAAIGLVGPVGRWVVVVVVIASGLLVAASSWAVIGDPGPVAASRVAEATGVSTLAAPVTLTAAPYAVVGLGLVLVILGAWLAATSRAWSRPSARHEAAGGAVAATIDDDRSAWDALTRGNDPSDPLSR